jgi:GTPase Era involved in 16S rRNA processing
MAGDPNSGARSPAVQQALSVVNLGLQAATAYKRADLVDRLRSTQRRLADPAFHVFVVGEFKQGKSSLVNALLNAPVCPVDDDIATSAPTAVGYGEEAKAAVLFKPPESEDRDGGLDPQELPREEIPVDQVARYVTEVANPANQHRVSSVEVKLPRKLLADGLVIVDTPGVGGLGSAHSAATIGALPMADAVIFVSDASQEFTAPELDFLQTARRMCPNVICVLTKTDFYPSWRKIRDLDTGHLERIGIKTELITVSSALRIHALRSNDRQLNQESGFPALVAYLQNEIAANAETITIRNAAADMVAVTGLIESQFRSERDALKDPERAKALVENLTEIKERANRLRSGVSKWQQTLNDGIQDLQADLDHELRGRIRQITKQADESCDNTDPVEAWDEFQAWLYRRTAEDVVHTYASLHAKARELTMRVNEHFGEDGGEVAINLAVMNPNQVMGLVDHGSSEFDARTVGVGAQSMTALRSSYGGVMMFGMLAKTAGLAMMNPATLVLGLFMGRSALKSEKERALAQRRSQAKQAHRKYTDEVTFVVAKDARDTLRRVQRQLRDFFGARAEELHRSTTEALNGAQKAVKSDEATRQGRLKDVEAELTRIGRLHKRSLELDKQAGAGVAAGAATAGTAAAGTAAAGTAAAGAKAQGGQQR